jgi:hypothetical protein
MEEILVEALTSIPFDLDTESLMKQVRVVRGTDDAREFHDLLNMAKVHGKPKAVYAECFIEAKGDDTVRIEGITFTSLTLRRSLDTVERVFPFVVTCGNEIDQTIPVKGDFLKEFWRDTVKESLLMSAHKYLCDYLHRKFRLSKTAIMSPGSGDVTVWPIEQQKELFAVLGDVHGQIGVRLTESCLMVPNKTVSGVRFPTENDFRTCQVCHRENCPSRSAPFDKEVWDSMQS